MTLSINSRRPAARRVSLPGKPDQSALVAEQHHLAFAANEDQLAALLARGWIEENIWTDLYACIAAFRNEGGYLIIETIGPVLGELRKDVQAASEAIEAAGIKLFDYAHHEHYLHSHHLGHALKLASTPVRMRNKRMQRRMAKLGGSARAAAAKNKRDTLCHPEIVQNLIDRCGPLREVSSLLMFPEFNLSALSRNYRPKS